MSVYTAHNTRSDSTLLGAPSSRSSSLRVLTAGSRRKLHSTSDVSNCENDDPLSRSTSKIRDINRTYVISACKKAEDRPLSPDPEGKLTLQRRVTRCKEPAPLGSELGDTAEKTAETSLALLQRTQTDSSEKWKTVQSVGGETEKNCALPGAGADVKTVNNDQSFFAVPSAPLPVNPNGIDVKADEKYKETLSTRRGAGGNRALKSLTDRAPVGPRSQMAVAGSGCLAVKPLPSKVDVRASGPGNLHPRSTGPNSGKLSDKLGSLEKRAPSKCNTEPRLAPKRGVPQPESPATWVLKSRVPRLQVQHTPQSPLLASKRERLQEKTFLLEGETTLQKTFEETDPLKVENCQVTVAIRVRPFSKREKSAEEPQVVFTNGKEVAVEHPGKRQVHTFTYDLSFWSVDERHPSFASQAAVYQALAAPLLEQAFGGFNTCLFAYGQTGSGKSYTMMGFNEEAGIIPRFCEDLFAQVAKKQTQEVSYHLEMSYFEVYNEKIHDLLVCKGENGQRKPTLRVREHPASGPYVEGLSTNVVSSYSDIQTEFVEGEELDHRIRSRINLVDLAGSERCWATQSSGERLREGVSINKSLLTLGKVVSALSEQAGGKRAFIPYRESVLTWLLKESLSGNSKTSMVATVSPAASSVEETLSTLRYAAQARTIVNVAKVNEDMSARLIRELKAEIEKLKAARRNSQNIDPERYRLCRQEITSLRMKLHQQERDMAEMQRMWKEKLEQAEQRKLQVTKELQKAGITLQMDNRLPNLVNLSEDPQLSEILLYVIKEGATTVGKDKPDSRHDIRLSGVLIAEHHCTINNCDGTVTVTPAGEAKTYVNGKLISQPTVLHHLEAEIKEAQLKAKEEMMQGIQIVREMAQQELSSQKAAYESKIKVLEAELKEESQRKKMQEINNQKANHKIEELEKAKQRFEQEIYVNKKRLEMEALATKQALEDHRIRHAKILEALEIEKQRIAKEVQLLQQNQSNRDKTLTIQPNWSCMKLSLMIQEANAISNKLKKNYVFGRHEVGDKGSSSDTYIQVRNLQLGISTVWSLEKFESKLAAMKELYESHGDNRTDDAFCDPEDEWEPDITNVPASSFSRRRSRSLMKNRRVSGCLQGLEARSAQDLRCSHPAGVLGNSSHVSPASAESFLPGVCKELIGSSLELLGQSYDEENTMADSLIRNFLKIHDGVLAISKAHGEQDEDGPCNLFSDRANQYLTVQVASAFEQLAVLVTHWLSGVLPGAGPEGLPDELRQEVRNLGACLQVFLQGCSSDISSMVTEAQVQVTRMVRRAVGHMGQLAALAGAELRLLGSSTGGVAGLQDDFAAALCDGVGLGITSLLDAGLEKAKELQDELLGQSPQNEVARQMETNALGLIGSFENLCAEWKTKSCQTQVQEDDSGCRDLKKMVNLAPEFLKLKRCLEQTIQIIISTLKGRPADVPLLKDCVESLRSSARGLRGDRAGSEGHGELESLESRAASLLLGFELVERPGVLEPRAACGQDPRAEGHEQQGSRPGPRRDRGVPKRVYELQGPVLGGSGQGRPGE
uniref:Kinesin-like protein KIF14 n=1 Tax=Sus scrofa TaxID=9823 RepID=A0A8D1LRL2_PIG